MKHVFRLKIAKLETPSASRFLAGSTLSIEKKLIVVV